MLTTIDTTFGHYGFASYRIEVDATEPHRPMQRHIWTRDDGTVEVEQWIPTISASREALLKCGFRSA